MIIIDNSTSEWLTCPHVSFYIPIAVLRKWGDSKMNKFIMTFAQMCVGPNHGIGYASEVEHSGKIIRIMVDDESHKDILMEKANSFEYLIETVLPAYRYQPHLSLQENAQLLKTLFEKYLNYHDLNKNLPVDSNPISTRNKI